MQQRAVQKMGNNKIRISREVVEELTIEQIQNDLSRAQNELAHYEGMVEKLTDKVNELRAILKEAL